MQLQMGRGRINNTTASLNFTKVVLKYADTWEAFLKDSVLK